MIVLPEEQGEPTNGNKEHDNYRTNMTTQPKPWESLINMFISATAEATPVPPHPRLTFPQPGLVAELLAACAGQQQRVDAPGQAEAGIQEKMEILTERLERIETLLERLVQQRTVKDWYTIAEAAELFDKAEFTVREWCRLGRVRAHKRACGRGRSREWMLAHEELLRIQNERLLPQPTISTRIR